MKGNAKKRMSLLCLLIFLIIPIVVSLEIAEEEIFSIQEGSVEFVNYEGPYSKIETAEEITGIGRSLYESTSYHGRYSVDLIIGPETEEGFDAVIFSILPAAQVVHVDNIRRILNGYLTTSFGYSRNEGATLATFITYYNAVYRKAQEYVRNNYKAAVYNKMVPEKIGLSTRYFEWSGNTQMLIPIKGERVDTEIISDEKVIEELRKEDDRAVDVRKEMVEIREREKEDEREEIEKEIKEHDEKETAVHREREKIEEEKAKIAEEKEELLTRELDDEVEEDKVREQLEKLEEEEKRIAKEEEVIAEQEEELERERKEIKEKEEALEKREDSIHRERDRIAEDQQEIIDKDRTENDRVAMVYIEKEEKEPAKEYKEAPLLLVREENGLLLSSLTNFDLMDRQIRNRSSLNTIRGRKYYFFKESILVVAGIDREPQAVRMVKIDPATLHIKQQGDHDMYGETSVLIYDDTFFAVYRDNNRWLVGRFDGNFDLIGHSDIAAAPYTQFFIGHDEGEDILFIQDHTGNIVGLEIVTFQ